MRLQVLVDREIAVRQGVVPVNLCTEWAQLFDDLAADDCAIIKAGSSIESVCIEDQIEGTQ